VALLVVGTNKEEIMIYLLLGILAVETAVLFLGRRRRPEVRFQWRISLSGDKADLALWPENDVPEVKASQKILIEAAIQNVGDRPGEGGLINFVVPDMLRLTSVNNPDRKMTVSNDVTAGLPPDYRVNFFAPTTGPWSPGDWVSLHYSIEPAEAALLKDPVRVRLLFSVSDTRFNQSGRRWFPSFVRRYEAVGAPAGTPWPPGPKAFTWQDFTKKIRRVRAMPHNRVHCTRGERSDVRDLILTPVGK
jgi:hypothetical protein